MTFVSYAQNFEDVILWRALKHIQKGFYIDVGAWSPDIDSVTRAFYENNWRGINVEPNPEFHAQYATRRPEDINLKLAVGDREGCVLINFMSNTGLSTAVDQIAKQHESAGWSIDKQEVSLTTLALICEQHIKKNQDIHFLKVDVEGLEEAALRGNDWFTYRPWIVLVEATLPMTQIDSYQEWEPILINAGYAYAYADGLNRFYVSNEHAELLDSFKYPPNVFDCFLLNSQQEAEVKAQQAEVKAQQAEVKAQQAEVKAQQAEVKAQQAEVKAQQRLRQLQAAYNSRSWRITKPLRVAKAAIRAPIGRALRTAVRKGKALAGRFPVVKHAALWLLRRMPFLTRLVWRFSETPAKIATKIKKPIRQFQELRSVRIMHALSLLPTHSHEVTVTFLEVADDVR